MPASPLYHSQTAEDIALSGPHVWPKIMADHAVDRFIFRRPELAYLVARKRMEERRRRENADPHAELMGVRIHRSYHDGTEHNRGSAGMQRFGHLINHESPETDVREFLNDLRRILIRCLPNQPLVNCSVQLRFYDYSAKNDQLLAWQERWL